MLKQSWLVLLGAFFVPISAQTKIQSFGVGFELGMTYGVASIAFPDGTLVDVAKVEGGPVYEQAMLNGYDPALEPEVYFPRENRGVKAIQSILELLPAWLRSERPHVSHAVQPMLKMLKLATENYLGMQIANATYVTPYPISKRNHEMLDAGVPDIALYTNPHRVAGALAARAHGIGLDMSDHDEQLTLAIEMSRAAISASVLVEDQGLIRILKFAHDLASSATPSMEAMKDTLGTLLTAPVQKEGIQIRLDDGLDKLVLFGQMSAETSMMQVLKDVLGEPRYRAAVVYSIPQGYGIDDAAYAASRGAAIDCAVRLTKCNLLECWTNSYLESDGRMLLE